MCWEHIRDEKRKKRKKATCDICGDTIYPGQTAIARTGSSDGEIITAYMHPECEKLTRKWDEMDWECHTTGDTERPKQQ